MVSLSLPLVSALVQQVRFATGFYLPKIKTVVNFAPTVRVSLAVPEIVVNIATISQTDDGRLLNMRN